MFRYKIIPYANLIRTLALASLVLVCLFVPSTSLAFAQEREKAVRADEGVVIPEDGLNPDHLEHPSGLLLLLGSWKYHPGDRAEWSDPAFDDRSWNTLDTLPTQLKPQTLSEAGWTGIGWFRLHLSVDPTLWDRPLAMVYSQVGAGEIYLDGQLIYSLGKVGHSRETEETYIVTGNNPEIIPVRFSHRADHVIAVRYSNFWSIDHRYLRFPEGFGLALSEMANAIEQKVKETRSRTTRQIFFSGVPLAFALLHLLLFLFYPESKGNLYYALFAGSISALAFAPAQLFAFLTDPGHVFLFDWIVKGTMILTVIFGIRFLYYIFWGASPWFFKVPLTIGILLLLFSWTIPLTYVYLYVLASFPEMLRIIFVAVRRKIEGANIIGAGCVAFTLGCTYQILMELHILDQENFFPYLYGILCLVVSMSVYLARNFARTSKDLNAQLIQVKELSANLEHANRQLEDYSQTLEQKVEERTRELNGKNIKLEETLYQLGESEERFRSVTQSANDAIVVADSSGYVISWNKGAQTIFGYREEEVLGQELALLMPEPYREAHRKGLERFKTTGEARVIGKTVELEGVRKDGGEFPLELSLDTWTTEKGTFFSGIIRDITERKHAEEELRKTQNQLVIQEKMASLGSLVAGVAHEMNTPIGAINSMHDTLIRAIDKLKETLRTTFPREYRDNRQVQSELSVVAEANRVIATGTERVTDIVRSLRNFARLDEAEFQVADLHEGIKHTLTLMQTQMGEHITVVEDYADLKPVYCSPGQLNQVFMHLLKNATQAIEGKGTIRIETSADQDYAYVKISDTGKGIPPEHMDKIFDPGFTTRGVGVGTGLGLSISYNIVQKHRGEIDVKSEMGNGSTFTVRIPAR